MNRKTISIRQLQNGKYQTSYRDPFTNRRVRKRFDSYKEAKQYQTQIRGMFKNASNDHLQTLKIKELMELHVQKCPETKVDDRRIPYDSFMDRFAEIELRNLSVTEVKNWLDDLKAEREYAEITMAHVKGCLNHFFNFLIDEGVLAASPLNSYKINRNAPPKKPRVFLTIEEVKDLLERAKVHSPTLIYPVLVLLAHTGARRKEVINLEWKHIDMAKKVINIVDVKNGSTRPIKISPTLYKFLEGHERRSKYVVTSPEGGQLGRSQLQRHIQSFKYTYPFNKDWGCHSLRHSFAYNFLKKGGQMYELMAVLGHKSIALTINLYGQLRSEDVEDPSPYNF